MKALALSEALLLWWSSAVAQDSCVVQGRLLGYDEQPMQSAYVRTFGPGSRGLRLPVRPDGSFSVVLPRPGGYFLAMAGVQHKTWFMPLLLEHPGSLELKVRLSTAEYTAAFDSVRVIGDFNGFATEGAVPMTRRADGTLVATVPCHQDTLRYQLLGVQAGGYPICGTEADTSTLDRGRPLIGGRSSSFVSVLRANRRPVQIVFDPRELPRGTSPPVATFPDSVGNAARIVAIHEDVERRGHRLTDAYLAFKAAGGAPDSFHWDASSDMREFAAQSDRERNPMLRGYLLLSYVQLALGAADSTRARRVFDEIPVDSPLWSLVWGGPGNTFHQIALAAKDQEAGREYAERVVEVHPDSSVRVGFLYHLLSEAHRVGDLQRAGRYYTRMAAEFASTAEAEWARKQFAPNRAIMKGNAVPDFAFASLEDSTRVYHAADFRGKYLLIDFWATWCGPCIGELRYLQRAHEDYKDRGLIILSVSFDENRDDVRRFRGPKWPMPWLHAFQPRGFASDAASAFEIAGIPRPILIDPEGRIVAVDDELRREELDRTLAAVLGRRSVNAPHKD